MKLTLICLRLTRHTDSRSILTALSRENGRVALGVPAGAGREARRLRALTMPLSMLTCETVARPGQEILPLRQAAPLRVTPSLHSHPVKQMMAMFVAETVALTMRQGGEDTALFDFVAAATMWLDGADEAATANFHICFLSRLAEVLGIEPDMATYKKGRVLDLRDGVWRGAPPLHPDYLMPGEGAAAAMLGRMTFGTMGLYRLTHAQRQRALDVALRYFSIHTAPLGGLRSLAVLRSLV